jgi:hypothetical protein
MNPLPEPQFAHDFDAFVLQNPYYYETFQQGTLRPIKKPFKLDKTPKSEKTKKDLKKAKEDLKRE